MAGEGEILDKPARVNGIRTILVGYDGTGPAEFALARATELATGFGAKVIVASVAGPESVADLGPGAFGLMPYYGYGTEELGVGLKADEAIWERHRERVGKFFASAGLSVEFVGVAGQPTEQIIDLADEHRADLIIVGTRQPGLVERLLGGSVSQGVARRAHCDVLIVHADEEDAGGK
jgi:nucleotide-binding universal stress UspA family protein